MEKIWKENVSGKTFVFSDTYMRFSALLQSLK